MPLVASPIGEYIHVCVYNYYTSQTSFNLSGVLHRIQKALNLPQPHMSHSNVFQIPILQWMFHVGVFNPVNGIVLQSQCCTWVQCGGTHGLKKQYVSPHCTQTQYVPLMLGTIKTENCVWILFLLYVWAVLGMYHKNRKLCVDLFLLYMWAVVYSTIKKLQC